MICRNVNENKIISDFDFGDGVLYGAIVARWFPEAGTYSCCIVPHSIWTSPESSNGTFAFLSPKGESPKLFGSKIEQFQEIDSFVSTLKQYGIILTNEEIEKLVSDKIKFGNCKSRYDWEQVMKESHHVVI